MSANYVVERGVPMPDRRKTEGFASALRAMQVGDSIFLLKRPSGSQLYAAVDRKYTCRSVEGGFRLWRIA